MTISNKKQRIRGHTCNIYYCIIIHLSLGEKGYHPINNPFFNAPLDVDNHIYNTPVDLLHTFLCGIIKSVLHGL